MADSDLTLGMLGNRARLERKVLTADGRGGNLITWVLRDVIRFAMVPMSSAERMASQQLTGVLDSAIRILYRSDIAITDRILFMSRVLNITSYQDPTGRRFELRLLVTEVQS